MLECEDCYNRHTQNVLNRMRAAFDAGSGMRISADELRSLSVTIIGQMWEEEDPIYATSSLKVGDR